MLTLLVVVSGSVTSGAVDGPKKANGAVIVRVDEGSPSHCVNRSTDTIYLTVRRLVTVKHAGLFTEDKAAGIVIDTTISGKLSDQETKSVTFPLMKEVNVEDYSKGHGISVPIEYPLARGFDLKTNSAQYIGLELDFAVIPKKKRNHWGNALDALANLSKHVSLPSFPFSEGFKWFAEYANNAVDQSLKQEDSLVKMGAITMNFSSDGKGPAPGQCFGDFEATGTKAVIQASDETGDGVVDINVIDAYQFNVVLTPAFVLKVCKKDGSKPCSNFVDVKNDYIGFYLNAVPESGSLVQASSKFRKEAVARCAANGVAEDDCLATRQH